MVKKIKRRKSLITPRNDRLRSLQNLADELARAGEHLLLDGNNINTPSGEAYLGIQQHLFRCVYHSLRSDSEIDRHDLLTRIKSTAVELMNFGPHYQSIVDESNPLIAGNVELLSEYAREQGLWNDADIHTALHSNPDCNTLKLEANRSISLSTGEELLDAWNDLHRQQEEIRKDYRQRVYAMPKGAVRDPLVIGVMTNGLYFAAIFYRAVRETGQHADLALVKMSRQDRKVHVFSEEDNAIRTALQSGRDVVVVDDVAHSFKSLLAIYDYFGKPPSMKFSAALYDTPLPRELKIIEMTLLNYLIRNPTMIPLADPLARRSLANILQYNMGIDRERREIEILPPIIDCPF